LVSLTATPWLSAQRSESPKISPSELVRATVANEVAADQHPEALHMFRSEKRTPKGSQTRLYVETRDALGAKLIAINGHPLTPQQQQAENDHLTWLVKNPDQLRKKRAREKEDEERTLRIVKALPDAFRYEYSGVVDAEPRLGKPGDQLVRLKFTPNPNYSPPSRVEDVLTAMRGELLIDETCKRLARIDGSLFRDVSFGWGIIGHLDKGGHFMVQQGDLGLGDGSWGITEMDLNMTGKILLFKNISLISNEALSDFRQMPENLTFSQGVEMLKSEQGKQTNDPHATEDAQVRKARDK
jgi:hypothetical protein